MSSLAVTTALQALLAMVPRALVPESVPSATKRTGSRIEEADYYHQDPDSRFVLDINNQTDSLTTRCYGVFGCFSVVQPYLSLARPVNVFPLPVEALTPKFCLYTRGNPRRCQKLRLGDPGSLSSSNFREEGEVKVLTHGYLEHGDKKWLKRMVEEFLVMGNLNVIVLDWLTGSGPPYTQSVANIRLIGAMLGRFILDLRDYVGVQPGHTHVVGHSLGAQLAGYTGQYLKERGASLGRITGLGTFQASGHLDFYPNGGIRMPGCGAHLVDSVAKEQGNIPYGIRRFIGCNHIRSYEYFTESINSACPFLSIECGSWEAYMKGMCWQCGQSWERCARMGSHADSYLNYTKPKKAERKMFLITGADSPFCTFHHRVSVVMSSSAEARLHGGDVGVFYVTLFGQKGASSRIKLNQEEILHEPGNVYAYVIGTQDLGHLKNVELEWIYVSAFYNPFTWRLLTEPVVHINRIHIDSIEMQERYEFCGLDKPFKSGTRRQLEWQAVCPEQAPPPGASFLGTIINFDVEDTIYSNIDAVNSGLNSLGNGQFINNLASSTNQVARELMEDARRRLGVRVNRRRKGEDDKKKGGEDDKRRVGESDKRRWKERRWRVWG